MSFLHDFTGIAGPVDLSGLTSQSGHTYSGDVTAFTVEGGRLRGNATVVSIALTNYTTSVDTSQRFLFDFERNNNTDSLGDMRFYFGYVDASNFYTLRLFPVGSSTTQVSAILSKTVAGSPTTLDSIVSFPSLANPPAIHVCKVEHTPTGIEVYINDVLELSTTDVTFSADGKGFGLRTTEDPAANEGIQISRMLIDIPDDTPPVITLPVPNPYTINVGDSYTNPTATMIDDVDGDISANVVVAGDTVDPNTEGTYNVTYDGQDAQYNDAVQVVLQVNVVAPVNVPKTYDAGTYPVTATINAFNGANDTGAGTLEISETRVPVFMYHRNQFNRG